MNPTISDILAAIFFALFIAEILFALPIMRVMIEMYK